MIGLIRGQRSKAVAVFAVAAFALAAFALAACGGSSNGTGSGSGSTSGGGGAGSKLDASTVSGLGKVLVDAEGFTLYHFTPDSGGTIACTGACASTWPPILVKGGNMPSAGSGVAGTISSVDRPDGSVQVTYDGLPLYRFSGDQQPGQANGQGIEGKWFAVTPSGKSAGSSGSSGASASPSSGYHY
jgi:predicted lipoprotein with Yx(FWY)xxD motif